MAGSTSALTTHELVRDAIDVLRDGDVILGGELATVVDPDDVLPHLREFARLVVEGWPI